jgi:LmbE family N-acetylglucosaminyl deacetylase
MSRPALVLQLAKRLGDLALHPMKHLVGAGMLAVLETVASDTTETASRKSCLVLAPHPDDETLGCGTTIMLRTAAGAEVHVAVATDGSRWPISSDPEHIRRLRFKELHAACGVLGLGPEAVVQWKFADTELTSAGDDLVDAIADAVRTWRPAEVLVTSAHDPHPDHAALGRSAHRALSGTSTRLLTYPIWQWDRPGAVVRMVRRAGPPEFVRAEGVLARKARAMGAYASQLTDFDATNPDAGMSPSFIKRFLRSKELFFPVAND